MASRPYMKSVQPRMYHAAMVSILPNLYFMDPATTSGAMFLFGMLLTAHVTHKARKTVLIAHECRRDNEWVIKDADSFMVNYIGATLAVPIAVPLTLKIIGAY